MERRLGSSLTCGGLTLLLTSVCGVTGSSAQEKPATAPQTPEAVKPPEDLNLIDRTYRLRPGDVIDILVERHPEYSRQEKLFTDGTINDRIAGNVLASGLTTAEMTERLSELYRKELKRPAVRVALRERYIPPKVVTPVIHPQIVVLGAVARQGIMDLPKPKWLRVLLAEIAPTERADLTRVTISYPGGKETKADFSRFLLDGFSKDDLLIAGGEEITIREREAIQRPDPLKIQVLGDVNNPGFVTVDGQVSILEVIQKAGGARVSAELEKVEVTGPKHATPKPVNVEAYMLGDVDENYFVQSGDVIRVARKELKVQVFGEVGRPGDVAIRRKETVATVYLQAGISGNGDASKAELIRRGPDGKAVRREINIRDIQKQRKPDVEMIAGDVLFIPHKKISRGPLYYLGQIAAPLWMVRSIAPVGL